MASITLNNVWKIYNKSIIAVKDVSLICEDGEFLALLGPSGCGKTSSLRMIAGLEDISAGEIKIGDTVVNHLRPKERDIAMVFETMGFILISASMIILHFLCECATLKMMTSKSASAGLPVWWIWREFWINILLR